MISICSKSPTLEGSLEQRLELHNNYLVPDVHHFLPLMMYSSPERTIELSMFDASDEATC